MTGVQTCALPISGSARGPSIGAKCLSVCSSQSRRSATKGTANLPRRQGLTQTHPAPRQHLRRGLRLGWQRRWPRWRLQGGALGSEQGDVPTHVSASEPQELMSFAKAWEHQIDVCLLVAKSDDLDLARTDSLLPTTAPTGVSFPLQRCHILKTYPQGPYRQTPLVP